MATIDPYYKISPSLFTAERLDIFDNLQIYISITRNFRHLENGERLSNLSTRIINKSLFHNDNINSSKKRDGVKNMYHILNPKQSTTMPRQQQKQQQQRPLDLARPESSTLTPNVIQRYRSHNRREDTGVAETVVKGFDPSTIITRKNYTPSPKNFYIGSSPRESNKIKPSKYASLFDKHREDKGVYYSSEDEESSWDTLSDDDEIDDEDDDDDYDDDDETEDPYYRKQWDNLLFTKSKTDTNDNHITDHNLPEHETVKRSLLSGLFLNEAVNTNKPIPSLPSDPQPPTSLTQSTISNFIAHPQSHRNRFMRDKPAYESNAPPAAQTILPTALSTHMFLPNNVHQQRLRAASTTNSDDDAAVAAQHSMSIPSKNSQVSFLKTRMELSEEEKFNKNHGPY